MNLFMLFYLFAFWPSISQAYIPPTKMIFEKVVAHSGTGVYEADYDLIFQSGGEAYLIKERWILGSEALRVRIINSTDSSLAGDFLYGGGQKWLIKQGQRKQSPLPNEFFERLFFLRSLQSLPAIMNPLGINIGPSLENKPLPKKSTDFIYEKDPLVRFARHGGVITWAFGEPAIPGRDHRPGGIWIEQDQFVIRKLRYPQSTEVIAEDFQVYPRNLRLAKKRIVRWGPHEVIIQLTNLRSNGQAKDLQPSALQTSQGFSPFPDSAPRQLIQEFYQRYR